MAIPDVNLNVDRRGYAGSIVNDLPGIRGRGGLEGLFRQAIQHKQAMRKAELAMMRERLQAEREARRARPRGGPRVMSSPTGGRSEPIDYYGLALAGLEGAPGAIRNPNSSYDQARGLAQWLKFMGPDNVSAGLRQTGALLASQGSQGHINNPPPARNPTGVSMSTGNIADWTRRNAPFSDPTSAPYIYGDEVNAGPLPQARPGTNVRGYTYSNRDLPPPPEGYRKGSLPGTVKEKEAKVHRGEVVIPKEQVDDPLMAFLIRDQIRKIESGRMKPPKGRDYKKGSYQEGSLEEILGGLSADERRELFGELGQLDEGFATALRTGEGMGQVPGEFKRLDKERLGNELANVDDRLNRARNSLQKAIERNDHAAADIFREEVVRLEKDLDTRAGRSRGVRPGSEMVHVPRDLPIDTGEIDDLVRRYGPASDAMVPVGERGMTSMGAPAEDLGAAYRGRPVGDYASMVKRGEVGGTRNMFRGAVEEGSQMVKAGDSALAKRIEQAAAKQKNPKLKVALMAAAGAAALWGLSEMMGGGGDEGAMTPTTPASKPASSSPPLSGEPPGQELNPVGTFLGMETTPGFEQFKQKVSDWWNTPANPPFPGGGGPRRFEAVDEPQPQPAPTPQPVEQEAPTSPGAAESPEDYFDRYIRGAEERQKKAEGERRTPTWEAEGLRQKAEQHRQYASRILDYLASNDNVSDERRQALFAKAQYSDKLADKMEDRLDRDRERREAHFDSANKAVEKAHENRLLSSVQLERTSMEGDQRAKLKLYEEKQKIITELNKNIDNIEERVSTGNIDWDDDVENRLFQLYKEKAILEGGRSESEIDAQQEGIKALIRKKNNKQRFSERWGGEF